MIIRHINDLYGTDREVRGVGWTSTRLLLKKDGMGFSMHETIVPAGETLDMHYIHHLEAVYCTAGEGTLYDHATNIAHTITPGTLYALNQHDKHRLTAIESLTLICVFNPPVTGQEVHDENGAYPLSVSDED